MEDSIPYRKSHFPFSDPNPEAHRNPIQHGKSYTMHFLLKDLIFEVFIVVLPLFLSQAPEFINHTILTKFWELIHVIFVGIAVSYGSFRRRNSAEMGFENSSNVGTSESYMPTVFPVSSNFDGGCEHPCGYGEKREGESWNSGYFVGNARPWRLRPLSVDETQYESMKTRSSTQTSSMSCSPKEDSFTHSMSSEVLNSKVENVKKRKSTHSRGSSSPSGFASSPPKPLNEKASVSALHSRGYSIGSFHEEKKESSSSYSIYITNHQLTTKSPKQNRIITETQ